MVIGAGAAALACLNLYQELGAKIENIQVFDRDGHIYKDRSDINAYQTKYAHSPKMTLTAWTQ